MWASRLFSPNSYSLLGYGLGIQQSTNSLMSSYATLNHEFFFWPRIAMTIFFFALQPPIYGAYLYDAVYQYAIALNKTLAEKEPLTGKNIANKLHDIQYDSKLLSWVLFLHRYHLSCWEMRCLVHCTVGWLSPGSRLGWVNVLCFWAKYSTLFTRSIDE